MNRRSFVGAILTAGVAPALVRASSLMPWRVLDSGLVVPDAIVSLYATLPDGTTRFVGEVFADRLNTLIEVPFAIPSYGVTEFFVRNTPDPIMLSDCGEFAATPRCPA